MDANNVFRQRLFNEHIDNDPNYMPLPEDRPGGFNWGEGAAPAAQPGNDAPADNPAGPPRPQ